MIIFRSGCVHQNEFDAAVRSGSAVGISLAAINLESASSLAKLTQLVAHIKAGKHAFIDNGLITLGKKGKRWTRSGA